MTDLKNEITYVHEAVASRQLDRRALLKRGVALGLSAPAIAALLAACGGDDDDDSAAAEGEGSTSEATTSSDDEPTETEAATEEEPAETEDAADEIESESESTEATTGEAGGHGTLRLLWWQAPTVINPHFALGGKDTDASRVCYEPLADFTLEGDGIPVLAAEMPSLDNGGVAEDGTSVTWKLRQGVTWHDGEPFTAEDVRFTWQFASNTEVTATTSATYDLVEDVEIVDDYTVTVHFTQSNPGWIDIFTGGNGMILPQHVFGDYLGAAARDAPANLMPIGTGPFKVREFQPGNVILYDRYEGYWDAGKPYFDAVELKGGGDAPSAARAVLEAGGADWAWNLQVEPRVLEEMAASGVGVVVSSPGAGTERLCLNFTDPNEEVDGAFSEPTTKHPFFQHKEVRQAVALACQRDVIVEQLYGPGGQVSANIVVAPSKYVSPNTSWEYDLDKAKELLDAAGFEGGNVLYQTTVNSVRQKTQEIIKQSLDQLGMIVEIKAIDSSVFFSSDAGNPDTYGHFYADMQMYTDNPVGPYLVAWLDQWRTDTISQKSNNWSGTNTTRYSNPEYDKLHDQARVELDPEKQIEQIIGLNDIVVNDVAEIVLVHRNGVSAANAKLTGFVGTPWASDLYDVKNWRLEE